MEDRLINSERIKRGDFLRSLGLSTSALMAFYCMGTLSACSKKEDPLPANAPTGTAGFTGNAESAKGKVDFTLDLNSSLYNTLKTEGKYTKLGDVLVARAKAGGFIAVAKTCTHAGGGLEYRLGQDDLQCDLHRAEFNTDGSVKKAPATKALKVYKTQITNNGSTLRVTE